MKNGRKPGNRSRARLALCAIAAVLAVGGCSDASDPQPDESKTPTPVATAPSLTGIIGVSESSPGTGAESEVTVLDPATGTTVRSVSLGFAIAPSDLSNGRTRPAFSADRSLVAAASMKGDDHVMVLARYDGTQYRSAGSWTATADSGGDVVKYADPRFNSADGRLWFVRRVETDNGDPDVVTGWFSVDPREPAAAPRPEKTSLSTVDAEGRPVTTATLPIELSDGTRAKAVMRRSAGGLISAVVDEEVNLGSVAEALAPKFGYTCDQQISSTELLCWESRHTRPVSSVVALSVSADQKSAVLSDVFSVALSAVGTGPALLSPDRGTVLQSTSYAGWYTGALDGSSTPVKAFTLPSGVKDADVFAWF